MTTSRVCVVGGATGSLGRAVVARLAGDGWRVVALHRRPQPSSFPDEVTAIRCDLSDPAEVAQLPARVSALGQWWGAVSCSGGFALGRADEVDDAAVAEQLELNLLGPWRLARAAAGAMAGGGRIVLTIGRAAVDPTPGQAAYQVSKAACARLVEVMARELRERRITINGVLPSVMDTAANRRAMPQAEADRWVPPERVAAAIAWLISDEAVEVSGALLPVYGRA